MTGGTPYGYQNIRINGHVERKIKPDEAQVIRAILTRAAAGEGGRTIAKSLNAAGTAAPRGRTWSPGSVRDLLHRTTYAGLITWNQSKKRDAEGQQRQRDRPKVEWLTVPAEQLRIVDESLWQAVRARLHGKRASANDAPPTIVGRGIRQRYLLAGFGRCEHCGSTMMVVSRASSGGRKARYCCSGYWNRGTTVCANGMMTELPATDQAVRDLLRGEVLQPRVIESAIDLAITDLKRGTRDGSHVATLQTQLAALDRELKNLAETAARGGAVPAVLTLLAQREERRRSVVADLDRAQRVRAVPLPTGQAIRTRLRDRLAAWHGLLARDTNTVAARAVLDGVLSNRIRFAPNADDHEYRLTLPVHLGGILTAVVPEFGGFTRNDGVPNGIRTRVFALKGPRPGASGRWGVEGGGGFGRIRRRWSALGRAGGASGPRRQPLLRSTRARVDARRRTDRRIRRRGGPHPNDG